MGDPRLQAATAVRAAAPWVERLARLGYAAKGVVYALIGTLAAQAAIGSGGATTDSRGVLAWIVTQPYGRIALALVAAGLAGYAVWKVTEAALDTEGEGDEPKGLAARAGQVLSGVLHAGLAWTAVQILAGTGGSGGDSTQDWTARLLSWPLGRWLVSAVGIGVLGYGLYELYEAYRASFREQLNLGRMSPTEERWATVAGRAGLAARGVVFGLIGVFLVQAALRADAERAEGVAGALEALARQPYGRWLLGIVALGLVAYGIFMLVVARYRRISVR
ncbi:MAG: hypothetical protein RLZZ387_3072 [Chloroflexota bacterium]